MMKIERSARVLASRGNAAGLALVLGACFTVWSCTTSAEVQSRAAGSAFQLASPDSSLGTDALWWDGFGPRGPAGPIGSYLSRSVSAVGIHRGDLVVAGSFAFMDGVPVRDVARWDGACWHAVGSEPPPFFDHAIRCFAVYDDQLIAGGSVTAEQGDSASCVVRLVSDRWSPLGDLIRGGDGSSAVQAMCVFDGDLIVGGRFTEAGGRPAQSIAGWNGHEWTPMGSDTLYGATPGIAALQEYHGTLYAGGQFLCAGSDSLGHIAAWRDGRWECVGGGADGEVHSLVTFGDRLVAGGSFDAVGSTPARGIATFDGTRWTSLASGVRGWWGRADVDGLLASGDRLVVTGNFDSAGAFACPGIAAWDGSGWSPLGADALRGSERIQATCLTELGRRLIVGGALHLADVGQPYALAAWDGTHWSTIAPERLALGTSPAAFLSTDRGLVVASGYRIDGDLRPVAGIARWDGAEWELLGGGVDGYVHALVEYRGNIVAGGEFTHANGVAVDYIAQWDGSAWAPLGQGVDDVVLSLAVCDDRLVAGGAFKHAGGVYVGEVARWDGSAWAAFGLGIGAMDSQLADVEQEFQRWTAREGLRCWFH